MSKIITSIYLLLFSSIIFISCSELEENIPINAMEGFHGEGVMDKNSSNFHGNYLNKWSFEDCQSCHANNFQGGLTPVNCADANCHASVNIHADSAGVNNPGSPNFHGKYLLLYNFPNCQQCHGEDFNGGVSSPSCVTCHSAIAVHKPGILTESSENFHGKYPLPNGFPDCQQCHGDNFAGGISSPSCIKCHTAIDVHKPDIQNSASPDFHGKYPLPNGFSDCQQCHGKNYAGGYVSPSCVTCHSAINVHQAGILTSSSPEFHGKYPLTNGFTDCQQCHGEDFAGGSVSPSCTNCHAGISVHQDGIVTPSSPNFHGKYIASSYWKLQNCSQCHGADYAGGIQSPTCLTCHNQPSGPEACNTCHGVFNDPSKIAPPQDLSGNTLTTNKGVGAHEKHLYTNTIGNAVECATCHVVPQSLSSFGHLDGNLPAEVNLSGLAISNSAGNANYNSSSLTCANTYCHGNFEFSKADAPASNQFVYSGDKMEGNNRSVIWNKVDGSEAFCGSCHSLPPIGHIDYGGLSTCVNCHVGVVNSQGEIIDKTKHINGVKNVFGN